MRKKKNIPQNEGYFFIRNEKHVYLTEWRLPNNKDNLSWSNRHRGTNFDIAFELISGARFDFSHLA